MNAFVFSVLGKQGVQHGLPFGRAKYLCPWPPEHQSEIAIPKVTICGEEKD
jgi:hypothetical protein